MKVLIMHDDFTNVGALIIMADAGMYKQHGAAGGLSGMLLQ